MSTASVATAAACASRRDSLPVMLFEALSLLVFIQPIDHLKRNCELEWGNTLIIFLPLSFQQSGRMVASLLSLRVKHTKYATKYRFALMPLFRPEKNNRVLFANVNECVRVSVVRLTGCAQKL